MEFRILENFDQAYIRKSKTSFVIETMVKNKKVDPEERRKVFEETGRCLICHDEDATKS